MDALLSAALQEVAVEGIQGELPKNFKTASLILQQNWKIGRSFGGSNAVEQFWKLCLEGSYLHSSFQGF
jgi:hypothetical protein